MSEFYDRLLAETEGERADLLAIPFVQHGWRGELSLPSYIAFLGQAYHHVKHTTPLLMACGSRVAHDKEWLRDAMAGYIEEELGHQEWILNDIRACGSDLEPQVERLRAGGGVVHGLGADLLDSAAREAAVARAEELLGGVEMLVNCAGAASFRPFADESPAALERLVQLNLVAPMLLTRQLLPQMLARGSGRIVNVGSTFGSIGFAWFAAYSASKFGLRGFSEALRRELEGTGVGITYVAPRAVKTRFNSGAVYRMAEATGMHMDEPAWVAARVVAAIEADAKDVHLGMPERMFARLNGFLPRLVDNGLRKQNRIMEAFARGG